VAAPARGASHGSNYLVLRLVVEETTGMTLRDAVRERVLEPLGLERTDLVEGPSAATAHGDISRRTTHSCLESRNPWTPLAGQRGACTACDSRTRRSASALVSDTRMGHGNRVRHVKVSDTVSIPRHTNHSAV
jgi:CubicO group peptidase (beta-lactamase class C family)